MKNTSVNKKIKIIECFCGGWICLSVQIECKIIVKCQNNPICKGSGFIMDGELFYNWPEFKEEIND